MEYFCFVHNLLLADGLCHVLQRDVIRYQCHAQVVAYQDGQTLTVVAQVLGEVRRVAVEATYAVLRHRSRHKHVEGTFLEIGQCPVKCLFGCFACLWCGYAEVHLHLFLKGHKQVNLVLLGIRGLGDDGELRVQTKRLAMIGCKLGRAIDDGRAEFQHAGIFECLEYYFIAHAVGIAVGDCYSYLLVFHFRKMGFMWLM